jgi:Zn-dependent protease
VADEPAPQSPVAEGQTEPAKRGGAGALGALLLVALAKGKSLLVLLKAVPLGKLFLTSFSMLAMIAFEAQRSGVWFGVGFVLLILVHELGHGYAMKRCGVDAGWPIFIPFFGAMISMKGLPQDRAHEAEIAYGGPLAGTAAALAVAAVGLVTESRLLISLAYTGFFLNLFNLTPISPLDGGRVAQAFSRRAWIAGAILLALLFFATRAPQLLFIAALALPRLFGRQGTDLRAALEPPAQRAWAFRYFGLAAFLGAASYFSSALLGRT